MVEKVENSLKYIKNENKINTGGPRYMRTFYLRFRVYAIEIMAYLRNVSSYLPMLLVSLYANSLYANHFFRSLSIAYNEVHLYYNAETMQTKN